MSDAMLPPLLAERTFFSESDVLVTNARLVSNGQTYAIAGITSVRAFVEPAKSTGTGWAILGAAAFLTAMLNGFAVGMAFGAIVIMAGILVARSQKAINHLILHSSSGEVRAISSTDASLIDRILAAVNNAIISRS